VGRSIYMPFKRATDIIFSLIGIIMLSPLFLMIFIAIKADSEGSVFFIQKRSGQNRRHFNIIKFRTMYADTPHDKPTRMLPNPEQYITKVGRFLRNTSLDEMPQLWNILIGEMSFIGPRPVICNETDLIDERDKYGANLIRPGLTGWAQINGRDHVKFRDKARLDGEYVKSLGIKMDLFCMWGTLKCVIFGNDIVEGQEAVREEAREAVAIKNPLLGQTANAK